MLSFGTTLVITLLSTFHLSAAAPANLPDTISVGNIEAAQATCQVTLCTDVNYGGSCVGVISPSAYCVSHTMLPPEYTNSVSTFGIIDNCICTLVTNDACTNIGNGLHLDGAGEPNLANQDFNDMMGSYLCNR